MTEAYNVEQSINNSSINLGYPKKNVSFPIARMTHFFSKSKKKIRLTSQRSKYFNLQAHNLVLLTSIGMM